MLVIALDAAEEITLRDGYSVEVLGIGTIEVNMKVLDGKWQKCMLYESLYVAKLSYNLLSVSKSTKCGKTFIFSETNCQLPKMETCTI